LKKKGLGGITVKDVPSKEFIKAYSEYLKRTNWLELPKWIVYVKTSVSKELAPYDPDWYYLRAASIARKIYLRPSTSIADLQKVYGGNNRSGPRPSHFQKSSGAIARHIVKQLEKVGIVEKNPTSKGGRKISTEGQRDLDRIAGTVAQSMGDRFLLVDLK